MTHRVTCVLAVGLIGILTVFVDAQQPTAAPATTPPLVPNAYASTYKPFPSRTTVIRNATILTAAGPVIERGSVLLQNGKIAAVGQNVNAPADARGRSTRAASGSRRASSTRTRISASMRHPGSSRCRTATR